MEVDYSPFLNVLPDGTIWWPLGTAVKLGAGFLPVRDDAQNLIPTLHAQNNRVRAGERTLLSEFTQDHHTDAHPRVLQRDDGRYVEANEFLAWLSEYLGAQAPAPFPFPDALADAVRLATAKAGAVSTESSGFNSLTHALEAHFESRLEDLPPAIRQRVDREFSPMPWADLSGAQRREVARQLDYQHDPVTEEERQFWWDFVVRQHELKKRIDEWTEIPTPTATDLALKEGRLQDLRREMASMERAQRESRSDYYPGKAIRQFGGTGTASQRVAFTYVAYPMAMSQLARRLRASPEELAAWVFWGPKKGGIAAYMHANEMDPPPRFRFPVGTGDFDYVQYLMGCWFKRSDIDQFAPADRYITGQALIDRWNARAHLQALPFIQAKIFESRLMELHPLFGLTRGSMPDQKEFPPVNLGLFALSQVEAVEATDFDVPELVNGEGQSDSAGATPSSDLDIPDQPNGGRQTPAVRTTVRREARKLTTAELYKRWRIAYRKSKKAHPGKSDVWHSQQIAKLEIAEGRNAETIRKHMKA